MKDEIVSFETAKLAKGKGFKTLVNKTYHRDGELVDSNYYYTLNGFPGVTQSLIQRWFRDEHEIYVQVNLNQKLYLSLAQGVKPDFKPDRYRWSIFTNITDPKYLYEEFYSKRNYSTYEEALEEGLKEALKLIG